MKTFISLFGGIGGFDLALERKGWKGVWYNDSDRYAVQTFNKNFGTKWEAKDIRTIPAKEIPEHDLLCAGFPCQAFSIAGKRKGFEDTRGTLFFEICRIAKEKKPRLLLLENVKGFLNHNKGKTFRVILEALDELGYDVEWQVLNSKHFGVPQNRERVFIIGHLRGESRFKIFPLRENAREIQGISRKEKIVSPTITTENAHGYGNNVTPGQTLAIYKSHRANEIREYSGMSPCLTESYQHKGGCNTPIVPCLTKNMGDGGNNVPMIVAQRGRESGQCFEPNKISNSLTKVQKDNLVSVAKCFTAGGHSGGLHSDMTVVPVHNQLRRLTPIECERLQGFPDNWTEGCSDTQRYKQLGNAVTVNVVEEIVKNFA